MKCSYAKAVLKVYWRPPRASSSTSITACSSSTWDFRRRESSQLNLQDRFRVRALHQVNADPGVQIIAAASKSPFGGSLPRVPVAAGQGSEQFPAGYLYVSPEYFQIFRLPILRGRNFTLEEAAAGAPVAIISQATAVRLWPEHDAVGQSLSIHRNPLQTHSLADPRRGPPTYSSVLVIGIARDAVNGWVGDGPDQTCIYLTTTSLSAGNVLFARVRGDADVAGRRLDTMLTASIPGAVDQIHTMDDVLAAQLYPFRALYWTSSALGGLALLLTLSGIYGVLSYRGYATDQRDRYPCGPGREARRCCRVGLKTIVAIRIRWRRYRWHRRPGHTSHSGFSARHEDVWFVRLGSIWDGTAAGDRGFCGSRMASVSPRRRH